MGNRQEKVVEAQAFILRDADGNISARLGTQPGEGPFLVLFGAGEPRLVLAIDHNGPRAMLANRQGKPVAVLECSDGSACFRIRAEQSNSLVEVSVTDSGPEVSLWDRNGKYMVAVRATAVGPEVSTTFAPESKAGPEMPSLSRFIQ